MTNRRQLLVAGLKLFDLAVMVGSFALATWVVAYEANVTSVGGFLALRLKLVNAMLFVGFLAAWQWILVWLGLYQSRRLSSGPVLALDLVKATSLGSLIIFNAGVLFDIEIITPAFVSIFWLSTTSISLLSRLALRLALRRVRARGRNLQHVVIVGTNDRARAFARKLRARPELGYELLGFVDDDWYGMAEFRQSGERLITGFDELVDFLRSNVIDEVVIALPLSSSYQQSATIVRACEQQGITVRFLSDIFNLSLARSHVELFEDEPVMTLRAGAMQGGAVVLKRALDFSLSLILLTVLAPLCGLIAVLIKVTSTGPVFFIQERVGLSKRKFHLIKFRTMVANAEAKQAELEQLNEVSGPVFKIKADPRLTPLGRLLRRTSIDELPQLFNVLVGEMSLVGPRPLPIRDYEGFDLDWHRRRFSVRPGITCLWQVNGRSSLPFEQWMELDMQYIDQWSLWLDLKILAMTIPAVLRGSGAV